MEKKECKVLGFGKCVIKDTGEAMLRILIGVQSNNENYTGLMVAPPVFLSYNENLERDLSMAIRNENIQTYYTTTDNIISGKTKVSSIFVENN